MILADGHPPKGIGGMHGLWTGSHGLGRTIHRLVIRGLMMTKVHGNVVGLGGRGMDAIGVTGIRRSTDTTVGRAERAFKRGVVGRGRLRGVERQNCRHVSVEKKRKERTGSEWMEG